MKEFLDVILSRIRSPFLGIASLVYIVASFPLIAKFIIVGSDEKLAILDAYHFNYVLMAKCIGIAILYIIVADWLQVVVDQLVISAREKRKTIAYKSQSKILALEYKSTKEYQEKLFDKELEGWDEEKEKMKKLIHNSEVTINELRVNEKKANERISDLNIKLDNISNEFRAYKDKQIIKDKCLIESLSKLNLIKEELGVKELNDGTSYISTLDNIGRDALKKDNIIKIGDHISDVLNNIENIALKDSMMYSMTKGKTTKLGL